MAERGATPALSARIKCVPLRARISEQACIANATREKGRPLGCRGCALGAAVRALHEVPEPYPAGAYVDAPSGPVPPRRALQVLQHDEAELPSAPTRQHLAARRDRSRCSPAEVLEAQRRADMLGALHGSYTSGFVAVGLSRATAHEVRQGRCSRGVLDVLRKATRKAMGAGGEAPRGAGATQGRVAVRLGGLGRAT